MKRIKVTGLNINRFIGELINIKIYPQNIIRSQYDEIIFEISNNEYKKLVANKISTCYNISVIKEISSHTLLLNLLKRSGLVLGVVVTFLLLSFATSKIWNININIIGNDDGNLRLAVEDVLKTKGVGVGQEFKFNTRDLERELLAEIDDCSSVIIEKNGVNLDISVTGIVKKPEQTNAQIVAGFSGVITDINLTSGILVCNVGEGVNAGQVLIVSGTVGDYYTEAVGEVFAKVLISGEAIGSSVVESMKETGEIREVYAYEIFGKTFFWGDSLEDVKSQFSGSEVEEKREIVFKNNAFPIQKITYLVKELKNNTETIPRENVIETLKQQAYKTAQNNLPKGATEGTISFDVFDCNGIIKVTCNIETVINIAQRIENK